jgi:site-specific DNA recombinase
MTAPRNARRRARSGPVRASIYVRMSLDKTGAGLGIDRQEKECRELCEREGWEVSEHQIFRDNDVSATTGKRRPGFEALLASDPDVIVTWHTDRLARLPKDLERVIELGINVHAVTAGHHDLSYPGGRAVARTLTAWATYEGEQKAERQRASARQRAASGKAWWPVRPFGFELDGTHRADEAAALVERYGDLLTGASLPTLARRLNEAGHTTCRGGQWTATTLRPVLLNARNAAVRVYEGEEVGPAAWAPIVPEETWRAAVRLLTNPARRTGGGGGAPRNLLTGVATCGVCGGSVKVGRRGGRAGEDGAYAVYVCRTRSCVSHRVEYVDGVVIREVTRLLQDDDHRSAWATEGGERTEESAALRTEEMTLHQRLTDLADDYADGILTRTQLASGSEKIRTRLAEIGDELVNLGDRASLASLLADVEFVYQEIDAMTEDQRRTLVRGVLASVELLPIGRGNRRPSREQIRMTPKTVERPAFAS